MSSAQQSRPTDLCIDFRNLHQCYGCNNKIRITNAISRKSRVHEVRTIDTHTRNHKEPSMGNDKSPTDDSLNTGNASDRKLRGIALKGSEQKDAADHVEYETGRDPDTELHLDGEPDTLYRDGIDLEEDYDTLAGTHGSSGATP
jgi:hypothetical protein